MLFRAEQYQVMEHNRCAFNFSKSSQRTHALTSTLTFRYPAAAAPRSKYQQADLKDSTHAKRGTGSQCKNITEKCCSVIVLLSRTADNADSLGSTLIHVRLLINRVLGQNGSGQNGTDKMVWTKWYTDKMVLDQMVRTKWYG